MYQTVVPENSILDVWQGSEYPSDDNYFLFYLSKLIEHSQSV